MQHLPNSSADISRRSRFESTMTCFCNFLLLKLSVSGFSAKKLRSEKQPYSLKTQRNTRQTQGNKIRPRMTIHLMNNGPISLTCSSHTTLSFTTETHTETELFTEMNSTRTKCDS
eukprot:03927_4